MSALVVDASVAAKWFLIEADSAKAANVLAGAYDLHAPSLIRIEVCAAVLRRSRGGALDEPDTQRKLDHVRRFLVAPAFTLTDSETLIARASEIALSLRHPLQDCLYIACAEKLSADLITADPKLVERSQPHFKFVKAL